MKEGIIKCLAKDLTKHKISNKGDLDEAITQIRAQINRWLEDRNEQVHTLNSVLTNKLVYYISKEINKVNDNFITYFPHI